MRASPLPEMCTTMNNTVYLDNAASSFPKPPCVFRAVLSAISENAANPGRSGHFMSEQAAIRVFNARHTVAEYFGLSGGEENVIFTLNATHAINTVINGVLQNGGHALISDMEHNSVLRPLEALSRRGNVRYDAVRTVTGGAADFIPAFRRDTKLVFVTHASNVTGQMLDIADIGKACRQRGILFAVDASQTTGHLRYDLSKLPVDFVCTAGHKGLFGPQGTGLLLLNTKYPLPPLLYGGTGTMSMSASQPQIRPEAYESGTVNTPGILGLAAGIDFLRKNADALASNERNAYEYALTRLKKTDGITVLTPENSISSLLAFNVRDLHSEKVTEILSQNGICVRGGYHCSMLMHRKLGTEATGVVRASFGGFNTVTDAEKLIFCLKKC